METLSDKNNKHGIFGPNYYSEKDVKEFIRKLGGDVDDLAKEVKNILDGNVESYVSKEIHAINTILSFYLQIQKRAGDKLC